MITIKIEDHVAETLMIILTKVIKDPELQLHFPWVERDSNIIVDILIEQGIKVENLK